MQRPGGSLVLFGTEAKYGLSVAMVVRHKGVGDDWVPKRLATFLDSLGSSTVTVKSDNEPAIVALVREVAKMRESGSTTLTENPEEGESQSNHYAEGGINVVKGLIRTLKLSVEERMGHELEPTHPLLPWIVEHAAQLRNRYQVGSDGKTPYERLRGRSIHRPIFEIGESVLYLPLARSKNKDSGRARTLGASPSAGSRR